MNEEQKLILDINKAVTNVPKEIAVNGTTLKIKSVSPRRMAMIDAKIGEVDELSNTSVVVFEETTETLDNITDDQKNLLNGLLKNVGINNIVDIVSNHVVNNASSKRKERNALYTKAGVDVVFMIVNDDLDKQTVPEDWIWDNVSFTGEDSPGCQVMDAYNEFQTSIPFFQKLLGARKLM